MILSPISIADLPTTLARFAAAVADEPMAAKAFSRIAGTLATLPGPDLALSVDPVHRTQAIALCHRFGMQTIDEAPAGSFTWDGQAVRVACEPSLIIHEVAHLQCAAPVRRSAFDFGLGAGPETGRCAEADAAAAVFGVERDREECMASLLGILWEAELGQPAIVAFIEQNWLEGGDKPANRDHFVTILTALHRNGLVDAEGRPTEHCRSIDDQARFLGVPIDGTVL